MNPAKPYKRPESVLVVLHRADGGILLLERADRPGFWQSVTGSLEAGETPRQTALREVREETGITLLPEQLCDWQESSVYEIYAHWRHRYAPGVTHNLEHVFSACIAADSRVCLAPREHVRWQWCDAEVAADLVFSPSNAAAIRRLPQKYYPISSNP